MISRVVIHPGFHKTGTTTVQDWLQQNRKFFVRDTTVILPGLLRETATHWAVRYSQSQTQEDLEFFAASFRAVLDEAVKQERPKVIISDENLLGRMPKTSDSPYFAAAPVLLAAMADVLRAAFGPEADLKLHLSLRTRATWLESLRRHHLMRQPDVTDAVSFAQGMKDVPDLDILAKRFQNSVGEFQFSQSWLEHAQKTRLGVGTPLLNALGMPQWRRDRMTPPQHKNKGPSAQVASKLLALNTRGLDPNVLATEKERLLKQVYIHD